MTTPLFFVNAYVDSKMCIHLLLHKLYFRETADDKNDPQCVDDQSQTQSEAAQALNQFWPKVMEEIRAIRNVGINST